MARDLQGFEYNEAVNYNLKKQIIDEKLIRLLEEDPRTEVLSSYFDSVHLSSQISEREAHRIRAGFDQLYFRKKATIPYTATKLHDLLDVCREHVHTNTMSLVNGKRIKTASIQTVHRTYEQLSNQAQQRMRGGIFSFLRGGY